MRTSRDEEQMSLAEPSTTSPPAGELASPPRTRRSAPQPGSPHRREHRCGGRSSATLTSPRGRAGAARLSLAAAAGKRGLAADRLAARELVAKLVLGRDDEVTELNHRRAAGLHSAVTDSRSSRIDSTIPSVCFGTAYQVGDNDVVGLDRLKPPVSSFARQAHRRPARARCNAPRRRCRPLRPGTRWAIPPPHAHAQRQTEDLGSQSPLRCRRPAPPGSLPPHPAFIDIGATSAGDLSSRALRHWRNHLNRMTTAHPSRAHPDGAIQRGRPCRACTGREAWRPDRSGCGRGKTAAAQDKANCQAHVDAARQKADEQSAQMRARSQETKEGAEWVGSRSRAIGMRTPGRFGSAWMRRRRSSTARTPSMRPSRPRRTRRTRSTSLLRR